VVGEFSGVTQRSSAPTSQTLLAFSRTVSAHSVVDFGVARGLAAAGPRWSMFAGVTQLLVRLW
jgi:hypothetical protein